MTSVASFSRFLCQERKKMEGNAATLFLPVQFPTYVREHPRDEKREETEKAGDENCYRFYSIGRAKES